MTPWTQDMCDSARRELERLGHPHHTPAMPSLPEGAIPPQTVTLPHKNSPFPETEDLAAPHTCPGCGVKEGELHFGSCRLKPIASSYKKFPISVLGFDAAQRYPEVSVWVSEEEPQGLEDGDIWLTPAQFQEQSDDLALLEFYAKQRGNSEVHVQSIGAGSTTCIRCGARFYLGEKCVCAGDLVNAKSGYKVSVPGIAIQAALVAIAKRNGVRFADVIESLQEPGFEVVLELPSPVVMLDATKVDVASLDLRPGTWVLRNPDEELVATPVNPAPGGMREVEAMRWANSLREPDLRHNPNDFGYILSWKFGSASTRTLRVEADVAQRALGRAGLRPSIDLRNPQLVHAVAVEMHLEHGQAWLDGKSIPEMIAEIGSSIPFMGALRFDEGTKVIEGTYDRSFLDPPRQHDSPLSARVVPAIEDFNAPNPLVGW